MISKKSSRLVFGHNTHDITITIAIPTFKRKELLLKSVESALIQQGDDIEIIIVDNDPNSTNELEKELYALNDGRLSYYKNSQNYGMTENWNRCIELSRGAYITILSDDDCLKPGYIDEMRKWMQNNIGFVSVDYETIDIDGKVLNEVLLRRLRRLLQPRVRRIRPVSYYYSYQTWGTLGCFCYKQALLDVGMFHEEWFPVMDHKCFADIVRQGYPCYKIKKQMAQYRLAVNYSSQVSSIVNSIEKSKEYRDAVYRKLNIPRFIHSVYSRGYTGLCLRRNGLQDNGNDFTAVLFAKFLLIISHIIYPN